MTRAPEGGPDSSPSAPSRLCHQRTMPPSVSWFLFWTSVCLVSQQNKCSRFPAVPGLRVPTGPQIASLPSEVPQVGPLGYWAPAYQRAGLLSHPAGLLPLGSANPPVDWGHQCPMLRDRCSAIRHCPRENRFKGPWWGGLLSVVMMALP